MNEALLVTVIMDALHSAGNTVRSFQMNGGHMIEVCNAWHSATIFPFPIEVHESVPQANGHTYRMCIRIEPARVVAYDGHTILPEIGDPDFFPVLFGTLDRVGIHVPEPDGLPCPAVASPFASLAPEDAR